MDSTQFVNGDDDDSGAVDNDDRDGGDYNAVGDDICNVGCTEYSKKRVREYAICPQAFRPDPRLEIECYYVGT